MTTKQARIEYDQFNAEVSALCVAHGGIDTPADRITDECAAFRIPTSFGELRASTPMFHKPDRRCHIQSIFLQWRDYSGPKDFPLHGDFNQFSHKWNICQSCEGATLADVRRHALCELRVRLELLAELTGGGLNISTS